MRCINFIWHRPQPLSSTFCLCSERMSILGIYHHLPHHNATVDKGSVSHWKSARLNDNNATIASLYDTKAIFVSIGLNRADKRKCLWEAIWFSNYPTRLTHHENEDNLRCAFDICPMASITAGLDLMELQDKWDKGAFEFDDGQILTCGALADNFSVS